MAKQIIAASAPAPRRGGGGWSWGGGGVETPLPWVFLVLGLVVGLLIAISIQRPAEGFRGEEVVASDRIAGIIVPHHLLVSSFMEKFYAAVAEQNGYDRVVILSPNHFGFGHNYIQSTDSLDGAPVTLDQNWLGALIVANSIFVEGGNFEKEHGVYVEYPFVAKYFVGAKVVPIMIKKDTPCAVLDKLAGHLGQLMAADSGRTLIIASLDYTHYSDEAIAVANDRATVRWLQGAPHSCEAAKKLAKGNDASSPDSVAIDSGEVLYVMTSLMQADGATDFTLWDRTSSVSLVKSTPAGENTSHIFGYFSSVGSAVASSGD